MALKPHRVYSQESEDISCYMNTTGSRGAIVSYTSTASGALGAGLDSSSRVVEFNANGSGARPVGMLLNDVVNIDLSRQTLNPYKFEVQVGSKVLIAKRGRFTTDRFYLNTASGAVTLPASGFCGPNGLIAIGEGYGQTSITGVLQGSGFPYVGKLWTTQDADGFAEFEVDL